MNLAPVLDAMGITEEDYFSSFRELRMGDRIYGIRTLIDADGRRIREEVLDSEEQPNIETLDLWGMLDWEKGTCTPLRTKEILAIIYEEAQTYCDGDKPLEEVCDVIQKKVQIYISENM